MVYLFSLFDNQSCPLTFNIVVDPYTQYLWRAEYTTEG